MKRKMISVAAEMFLEMVKLPPEGVVRQSNGLWYRVKCVADCVPEDAKIVHISCRPSDMTVQIHVESDEFPESDVLGELQPQFSMEHLGPAHEQAKTGDTKDHD